jgi:hypothetical protein
MVETKPDVVAARWAATVAAPGGVLAGSRLTGRETAASVVLYTIELVPSWQDLGLAVSAVPLIALGLGLPPADVVVASHSAGIRSLATLLLAGGTDQPVDCAHRYAVQMVTGHGHLRGRWQA